MTSKPEVLDHAWHAKPDKLLLVRSHKCGVPVKPFSFRINSLCNWRHSSSENLKMKIENEHFILSQALRKERDSDSVPVERFAI
jgi:hypothetical protein